MEDSETLVGERGSYTVQERLPFAQGRISVLYKATDRSGDTVCIKWFEQPPIASNGNEGEESDYWAEVNAQMRLDHPNVLPVLDYGKSPNPFIVYPLCLAGTLRNLMTEREFAPLDSALPILKQVASAIDYAHSSGIIHGDIKPENILFKKNRSVPLLGDFGMSKHFPHLELIRTIRDMSAGPAGTSAYLSPEQIGEAKQSPLSDIYAFGVVCYELLTGQLPFDIEAPPFKQMQMKVSGELIEAHDANPSVSPRVSAALRAALALDRRNRPKNATDFYKMLSGEIAVSDKGLSSGWLASLDTKAKVALVTALIGGAVAIITAFVQIIPDLIE